MQTIYPETFLLNKFFFQIFFFSDFFLWSPKVGFFQVRVPPIDFLRIFFRIFPDFFLKKSHLGLKKNIMKKKSEKKILKKRNLMKKKILNIKNEYLDVF